MQSSFPFIAALLLLIGSVSDFDQAGPPADDYLLSFMPDDRSDRNAFRRLLEGRSAENLQNQENVSFSYDWTLNGASK